MGVRQTHSREIRAFYTPKYIETINGHYSSYNRGRICTEKKKKIQNREKESGNIHKIITRMDKQKCRKTHRNTKKPKKK